MVESEEHVMPTSPLPMWQCAGKCCEEAGTGGSASANLYEWVGDRQCLALVNSELAGGKPRLVSECGAVLGEGLTIPGGAHEAVSSDGSKVFFTAPDPNGGAMSDG